MSSAPISPEAGDGPALDRAVELLRDADPEAAAAVERLRGRTAATAATETLLRETLDTVDASIVVYDDRERFVFANRKYHALYPHLPPDAEIAGCTFEALLRRTIAAGTPAEPLAATDPEGFVAQRLAEWRGQRPGRQERLHPSGRWDLVRTAITERGHRVSLRVDISEQKRMQAELEEARIAVEEASAAKSRFLAAMSHELRTPLNAIIGFAELMQHELFGPLGHARYAEYAADVGESGKHLLALINDLLDLSKIEAGSMEVRTEQVDAGALLQAEADRLRAAVAPGVGLTVAAAPGCPAVAVDARMLRQIGLNLLSNAIKFTPAGAITVGVMPAAGDAVELVFADTGHGMAPVTLERIGEPFFQESRGPFPQPAGTGLGLALVRQMVALNRGTFAIESTPGIGTTVRLRFPAARAASRAAA